MFIIAVLSFIAGIYVQAAHPFSLRLSIILSLALIPSIAFLIRRRTNLSILLVLVCFVLAGMIRLGVVTLLHPNIIIDENKEVHEGLVVEASQNTKVIRILSPDSLRGVKAIFRTPDNLNINDRIRVFGQIKELTLTSKNPYLTTWKWLKRLEGISYELKGALISVSPGDHYIHSWRNYLKRRIEDSGAEYSGIIKALTIGDTTGIEDATKTLFLRTGTSHILAISGSNIGIVTAFFFFIARIIIRRSSPLRLRGDDVKYASLLSIPFTVMFMLTAGSSIPTIRATIMITVYMLSLVFERGRNIVNTIALSALIILLIYPHSLFMPTFQLTFMSVLFLALFTDKFYSLIRVDIRLVRWLLSTVLMTVAATLGTLPIVIYHFYGINPFSVIYNIIAIPLMCIVAMPLSLVGMALPYGEYLLRLSGEILGLTIRILDYLNVGYIYPIIRPDLPEIALYFAILLSLIYMRKKPAFLCLLFVILPVSIIHTYFVYEKRFHNTLSVNFLDVGAGDAMLIEAPQGIRMLIDGGGSYKGDYDVGKSVITPMLLSKKILTLDYVINTHPHGDHIGGLPYVLNSFKVKAFATGGYFLNDTRFQEIQKIIRDRNISFHLWNKGDRLTFKDGMEVLVLSPRQVIPGDNPNNASLVLKLAYKNTAFLLTGDMDSTIEEDLILSDAPLRSNIMKIPHHGSKYSSSMPFLYAVKPDLAVLTAGSGMKGLPSDETIERYRKLSIPILRTDLDGFIEIHSDGERIWHVK